MKILIVGAGPGGLMLAACLQQLNLDYDLIEQSSQDSPQGFSFGLWCNTRTLFANLGLQKQFDSLGTPLHTYNILTSKGRLLRSLSFQNFYDRYGMAYTQINRHELRSLLLSQTDPARLLFQTSLQSLDQSPNQVTATFSNNQTKSYDLLVGADGIRSAVRNLTLRPDLQTYTGWRAYYIWIDQKFCPRDSMVEYLGPRRCLALFADGAKTLAVFFTACPPTTPDDPTPRLQTLKSHFQDELKLLPHALDEINPHKIMTTDLATIHLKKTIHNRVLLIGDAAHTFEPHTGLGASMAMEDAATLATQLSSNPLATALETYEKIRRPRIATAIKLNKKIRTFAFIKSCPLRALANTLVPLIPDSFFVKHYHQLFAEHCSNKLPSALRDRQTVAAP